MSERHNGSDQAKRAFFGRRKGHALKPRQAALFDTALPRLALDLTKPAPADLRALFDISPDEVRLEIGFGGAEHLIAQAQAHPRSGFIGSDAFVNAIGNALAAIDADKLGNIRLHFGDASALIDWLPAGSLARIDLLYPDPWPKRRHWKRRFIQDDSLKRLARILNVGGEMRFATDIAGYAAWALARVLRSKDFAWTAEVASDWRKPWPEYSGTRYEAKAKREGRVPAYFIFRKL
ncbi:MAG TPA: tRNA (guanine(46)-N(7))-methyltransferase TrmB [Pseudolabrys sp.]|nr:tRNA (guanine(46)-N(7))-methyltransferase TrmB [Pseudolabrys sp.]